MWTSDEDNDNDDDEDGDDVVDTYIRLRKFSDYDSARDNLRLLLWTRLFAPAQKKQKRTDRQTDRQ